MIAPPKTFQLPDIRVFLLHLTILSLPFDIWAVATVAGRGIKPVWAMGAVLVVAFTINLLVGRGKLKVSMTGRWILVFNAIALLSLVNLINTSPSHLVDFGTEWVQLVLLTLLFLAITSLDLSEGQFRRVLQVWVGLAFVLSLYAIYQVFARPLDWPFGYLPLMNPSMAREGMADQTIGPFVRPSSVFAEPSFFGSYLLSPLFLSGVFWLYRDRVGGFLYRNRALNWLVFGTIAVAFLFAFSMGAYAALGGALLIALLNRRLAFKLVRYGVFAVALLAALGWTMKPVIGGNFAQIVWVRTQAHLASLDNPTGGSGIRSPYAKTSIRARFQRAEAALSVWADQPLTGVGLNVFGHYYPEGVAPRVHGAFLQALVEMGMVGLFSLIAVFATALSHMRKLIKRLSADPLKWAVLTAFYYSVWALVFALLLAGTWVRETMWMALIMAILATHWVIGSAFETQSTSQSEAE